MKWNEMKWNTIQSFSLTWHTKITTTKNEIKINKNYIDILKK